MVIEIELRQLPIEALITLEPLLLQAHLILSYPGRSGEVQPCLQAKAKLTRLHVIEYCTSAEQDGGRVRPSSGHAEFSGLVPGSRQNEFTATNLQNSSSLLTEDFRDSHEKRGRWRLGTRSSPFT